MHFGLVHGSWHDGSAWSQVINRLVHHGHSAFGPTVAGHRKGVCKNVSHAQSTQSVVDFIVSCGLTDIVLVGHSYGGTIISKVAEVIPDRIRRLVFWSGFVLNDGESLNDAVPPHFRELFRGLAADSPDNSVMQAPDRLTGAAQPRRGGLAVARPKRWVNAVEPAKAMSVEFMPSDRRQRARRSPHPALMGFIGRVGGLR
jgi:pimeloyl-ACP methyl ester carboxylesterase